jgi:hypothetical protein
MDCVLDVQPSCSKGYRPLMILLFRVCCEVLQFTDVMFLSEQLVVYTFAKLCHAVWIEGSSMSSISI